MFKSRVLFTRYKLNLEKSKRKPNININCFNAVFLSDKINITFKIDFYISLFKFSNIRKFIYVTSVKSLALIISPPHVLTYLVNILDLHII